MTTKPRENENVLLKKFMLEYSQQGQRLFRCNTGSGWQGQSCNFVENTMSVTLQPGDMFIKKARPFRSGWPTGTSDLMGWTKILITPDMVGRTFAVITAVEAKTKNVRATKQQSAFIRTVNEAGGIAMIARKLEDSGLRPGDMLGKNTSELALILGESEEKAIRLSKLLERGGSLAIELERLSSLGVWVRTRADEDYPTNYKQRLKDSKNKETLN